MPKAIGKDTGAPSNAAEFPTEIGQAGELHQTPPDGGQVLTTQQGVPVADDQNTLRVGPRGPALLRTSPPESAAPSSGAAPDTAGETDLHGTYDCRNGWLRSNRRGFQRARNHPLEPRP